MARKSINQNLRKRAAARELFTALRTETKDNASEGAHLAGRMLVRGIVEIAVASFNYRTLRGLLEWEAHIVHFSSRKLVLHLSPDFDGALVFHGTISGVFPSNDYKITPEQFDVSDPAERARFEAYRAFIKMAALFGKRSFCEGHRKFGPFIVSRHKDALPLWKKVLERWAKAHKK